MAFETERARVAHLLRRAGFGSSEAELDSYTALGFAATLDRLLNYEQVDDLVDVNYFEIEVYRVTSPLPAPATCVADDI